METPQQGIKDAINSALRGDDLPPEGLHPAILVNQNIDHTQVEEYAVHCANYANARSELNQCLAEGFVLFRLQTEFCSAGHITMAYLAKMKAN